MCRHHENISVIIPSFNGEAFIAQAIQSINRQSLAALEIIVVDDGSTDRTKQIVEQQKGTIIFIQQDHTGNPAAGRNRGINEASGGFIAFLDQDDLWPENKLAIQLQNFRNMPHLHIDVGFSKIVTQTNQSVDNAELKRQFLLSSMLINKTAFEKIGLFDESMQFYGSDLDWVFRAREEKLNFHMHDQPTLHYYLHENNHSKNEEMFKNARIEVMKKSIQRRKSANSKAIESIPGFINSSKK